MPSCKQGSPADPGSHRASLAGTNYARFKWPHRPPYADSLQPVCSWPLCGDSSGTHTSLLLPHAISVPFLGSGLFQKGKGL